MTVPEHPNPATFAATLHRLGPTATYLDGRERTDGRGNIPKPSRNVTGRDRGEPAPWGEHDSPEAAADSPLARRAAERARKRAAEDRAIGLLP